MINKLKNRLILTGALLILTPQLVLGQDHIAHGLSGLAHGIPDFCSLPVNKIIIPAGTTRTLSGNVDTSCIGVHGVLIIESNTTIKVDNFLEYSDGVVQIGTQSNPAINVNIIIKNNPLNTQLDPEQFAQGIIGFGKFYIHGLVNNDKISRSVTIKSESFTQTRGHVLFSQQADIDIRYVAFLGLGRTDALRPLDSTTYDGDTVTHIGLNQIGKYSLHLHHVRGLINNGKDRQFYLIGNLFSGDSKWSLVLHNSHFGQVESNVCINTVGACYVEEDGSETDNHWIGNYAKLELNPSLPQDCQDSGYDPEGRCSSGFWLRGVNQVLKNNIIDSARVGIGWWPACREQSGPPCGNNINVTIPMFPGADTTIPSQVVQNCKNGELAPLPIPCQILHRVGLEVSGNIIRNTKDGLEQWWSLRARMGGAPITNTTMENVTNPIAHFYSDVVYDGIKATSSGYTGLAVGFYNDGQPIGFGTTRSVVRNADFRGYDACFNTTGQQDQPPMVTMENLICQSTNGIVIRYGGQGYGDKQDFQVINPLFIAPPNKPLIGFTSRVTPAAVGQQITTTVTKFNGNVNDNFVIMSPNTDSPCMTTRPEVVDGFACPIGVIPNPNPDPIPPGTDYKKLYEDLINKIKIEITHLQLLVN